MLKKAAFFDFLNRHREIDFDSFVRDSVQDVDYIDWHGFVLPSDYGNAEQEYHAIRNGCALFDASPIRKYRITGPEAGEFLDLLCTRSVSSSSAMRGVYVAYCHANGALKDDSIVYKYADDDYLLMPADIDHDAHFEALRRTHHFEQVSIVECTDSLVGMSIQGPMSATLLDRMGVDDIALLEPFEVCEAPLGAGSMMVSRMGFTADLGYECWLEPPLSETFQQAIVDASAGMDQVVPGYGLAALEACRLEGGLIVPGWDCSTEADPNPALERTPFELGIGWLVDLKDRPFFGRDALLNHKKDGPRFLRRSVLATSDGRFEPGARVRALVDGQEQTIGSITCSAWSWGLERMVGSASVEKIFAAVRNAWTTDEGSQRVDVELKKGPLVDLPRRNEVPAPVCTGP